MVARLGFEPRPLEVEAPCTIRRANGPDSSDGEHQDQVHDDDCRAVARHEEANFSGSHFRSSVGNLIPLAITGTYSGAIVITRWSPL